MQADSVQTIEMVFLLLLFFVAALGMLAKKLQIPYPIVLVVGGGLLGFLPLVPKITLNPDAVFFVVLPPLLYYAAWQTSWRDFRNNLVNISFLAFGLVAFTVVGVAATAQWLFPGFDWRIGLILGAVIAPTDALAATTIARTVGLPKQISDVLEGESLVNDASGLLALEFGIAIALRGQTPTFGGGVLRMVYLTCAGLAIGLAIAWIVDWIERHIDDAPIEIAISILVPYFAYFAADRLHASGVLAVVACGLYLSRRSSGFFSPGVRLEAWAVWDALNFILNGLVFVLIGLQLPHVLAEIQGYSAKTLFFYGALFSALVIGLRVLWTFPGAHLAFLIRRRVFHHDVAPPTVQRILVIGWTGMRGVIALAAAIALPQTLADGRPFVQRNLIVFLAFCVIFVTLVLQGLTLPFVVRALGLANAPGQNVEEERARRIVLQKALAFLHDCQRHEADLNDLYDDLIGHYEHRLKALEGTDLHAEGPAFDRHQEVYRIFRELSRVERGAAIQLRDSGEINDEVLRQIEHELDLRDAGNPQP